MPWSPELFSAPVLQDLLDKRRRDRLVSVPFFDGLIAGEPDALVESFAGVPELHHPVRGRIKGERAFREYIAGMSAWLVSRHVTVHDVERVILPEHGFEEVILQIDGPAGRVDLPFAVVTDHPSGALIEELRIYYSNWPLSGRHAERPPLLQHDPDLLGGPDAVAAYHLALAAGDLDAAVAAFEPDGFLREPSGGVNRGPDGLRAFHERLFSGGGGLPLEHCALVDDGTSCALEYNLVRQGDVELPPQAGVCVYVRGGGGRLAAARVYDDAGLA
jgi:hypothetical protein